MSVKEDYTDLSQFYNPADPKLSDQAREILLNYSKIPEDEVIPHLRTIRDKAWALFHYPCVGQWRFLDFSIGKAPDYTKIIQRIQHGEKFLDLGCCFGHNIRRLVYDGAPSENLTGTDLRPEFLDWGYDLFKDRDTLKSTFTHGDFFEDHTASLKEQSFDLIYAAAFFHLFSWNEQVEATTKAVGLLKPKAGSVLFGQQVGGNDAGSFQHPETRSGELYRHNEESLRKLIAQVQGETGLNMLFEVQKMDDARQWEKYQWSIFRFSVTLQ